MIIRCPVMGCAWETNSEPDPAVTDMTLASVFGPGVVLATQTAQKRQQAEVDTRRHLESHDVLDFVKTIRGLEDLVAGQVNTMMELTGQRAVFGMAGLAPTVDFERKT